MYSLSIIDRTGWSRKNLWPKRTEVYACATVSIAYYLAVKIGLVLTVGAHPVSLMWPANAVLLGALLLRPSNQWGWLLLAVLPAHIFSESGGGIPLSMVLCWYVSNCSEALLGAGATRWCMRGQSTFDSFRSICAFFACGVILGPVVSSFADAALVSLNHWGGDPFWEVWRLRTLSNIFTAATVGVTIVTLGHSLKRSVRPTRVVEGALLVSGLAATVDLALSHATGWQSDFSGIFWLYAPWPFLLWAALRFGPAGASGTLLIVSTLTVGRVVAGRHPFLAVDEQTVRSLQVIFLAQSLTLIPLAAVLLDRKRAETNLQVSEMRYRGIVETQPDLVCRFFADTTLSFVNKSYCKFFGCPEQELIGRRFLDFIPPARHEAILSHIATILTSRQTLTTEHEVLLPNGGVGWQQWINHPILNEDGWIREIQAIGRDITQRKHTEAALQEIQAKNQAMLTAFPDSIFLVDREGRILDCRAQDASWLLLPVDQCIGRHAREVVPAPLADELELSFTSAAQREGPRTLQTRLTIEGADCVYEMRVVGCGSERLLCLIRDITEQKHAEEVRANMLHASRLAAIGEFTAIVSHEVNQPLAAILINIQAIRKLAQQPHLPVGEVLPILNELQQDVMRARDIVSRLRALSQKRAAEIQAGDINHLIEEVVRLAAGDAQQRHVQLRTELEPQLPYVQLDPVLIEHVLLNLIANGMESMSDLPTQKRVLTLKTEGLPNEGFILISVKDRGRGIPAEVFPLIFNSFFSTKEAGVGLGLSVARTLVQAHHGRIWAENNLDQGATFRFCLPAQFRAESPDENQAGA